MGALTVDHSSSSGHEWEDLVRLWEETDAPEGCKVEIIEGIVTVSPPPDGNHNYVAELVQLSLYPVLPKDCGIYQTLGIAIPSRRGLCIPDLVVVPREIVRQAGGYAPAGAAELIVEVTSKSNASHDRVSKPAAYARAGVPFYLLVDRYASGGLTVTLYSEPKADVYRVSRAGKLGEEVHLPEPFGVTLDTHDWS